MRRSDKEITDKSNLENIFKRNTICRLAFAVEGEPYVVPMSYGYENNTLFFHCAAEGRKLDMIKVNNRICFEISDNVELFGKEKACSYSVTFCSIIGYGRAVFINDNLEKERALSILMAQHTGEKQWTYSSKMIEEVTVFKIKIESFTGKENKC